MVYRSLALGGGSRLCNFRIGYIYIYIVGCSRRCEGALAIYDAKYLYRIIRPGVFETHLQVKLDPASGTRREAICNGYVLPMQILCKGNL